MKENMPRRVETVKKAGTTCLGILAFACFLSGCSGEDLFYKGSDQYYMDIDPSFATAVENGRQNALRQTQAVIPTLISLPDENAASESPFRNANDFVVCDEVDNGQTVSDAVLEANNGVWPPYLFYGQPMKVSLDHDGDTQIADLQKIMSGADTSMNYPKVGDTVCIGINETLLEQQPTPTPEPQPSILP